MPLNIISKFNESENLWMMNLAGEIDIYTANKLKESLTKVLNEKSESVRIDCEELDYIDSTGLGVLIGTLKRLKQDDKNIIIYKPKPNILKLLNITGLNKIFIVEGE